jgi:hypothetical protein
MEKHKFDEHPERIFNIDETGINAEHTPPKIVFSKGKDFLEGCLPGSAGEMSDSGW